MSEGYQLTASGLLRKRQELAREADELRSRLAAVANDLAVIERALSIVGCESELPEHSMRAARITLFFRGELRAFLHGELSKANHPLTTRELASRLMDQQGRDVADRRLRDELVKRIGWALRRMESMGVAQSAPGPRKGQRLWRAKSPS
jgi:hypothetical protein